MSPDYPGLGVDVLFLAPNPMKPNRKDIAALAFLAGALSLAAQTPATPPATPASEESKTKEEVVHLSPFLVSAGDSTVGRYSSLESTSGGRVRVNIMDSSQNVSVITSDVLTDVGAGRILDATKYIAGISESTLGSNAQDRTNVRGFQADGHTVDGFTYGGFINLDPAIVDRIEVVKGPNSILAPQPTSPGGTVNNATKKPIFKTFGSVSVRGGDLAPISPNIDFNQGINAHRPARVVASSG